MSNLIDWLRREMPAGTVIGSPDWWAKRIAKIATQPDIKEACIWWEGDDGGPWATQCNELFNIENEGPEANGMRFCCFCGKKLVEVAADTDEVEKWKDENL